MFRKSIIKNQGGTIINSGKKAVFNGRTAATSSQMQGLRVDEIKPNPVQYAVMMLTDIDDARKLSHGIMNQKLNDFEVR